MKNVKIVIFIFFILFTSCNSTTEVVEKYINGNPKKAIEHYENDSTCEKYYYENGQIETLKYFKSGKQTGVELSYREDGTKAALTTFRNGIRHGQTIEYYSSGQIGFEGVVENGEFEGLSKGYYENGKLEFTGNRQFGKDIGWWYYFNIQGDTIRRTFTKSINDTKQYFDGKGLAISAEEWENIKSK